MTTTGLPLELAFAERQDLADLRQQVPGNLPFGIVIYDVVTPTTFRFSAANKTL